MTLPLSRTAHGLPSDPVSPACKDPRRPDKPFAPVPTEEPPCQR